MTGVGQMGITGLASDSREVAPGYLFAALPGSRADGARYVAEAVRRGAKAVLGRPSLRAEVEALGARFIGDENPRKRLAKLAAEFAGGQPETIAAVTGTNGKTSVTVFLRQIWESQGRKAASMGTIGLVAPSGYTPLHHTTPDAIALHALLAKLLRDGVEYLALEASSHGLDQYRLDGVRLAAAAFTNITRDHLDYHPGFAQYLAAKLRLFSELLPAAGIAVVNADADRAEDFSAAARLRGVQLITTGKRGESLRLVEHKPLEDAQLLVVGHAGRLARVTLPLVGDFQASNALVAAGLAIGLGEPAEQVFAALGHLKGATGRLEKVAISHAGAPIYVDYAHTPDALENVLTALRPHIPKRLHVVFGCGGDRDKGKRGQMGAIASRCADRVIVTDDNPRSEEPGKIRRAILVSCPGAIEIADRAEAIGAAIAALEPGDALVIAGKGHESGQILGNVTRPFLDSEVAIEAARLSGGGPA